HTTRNLALTESSSRKHSHREVMKPYAQMRGKATEALWTQKPVLTGFKMSIGQSSTAHTPIPPAPAGISHGISIKDREKGICSAPSGV
ncbi:MAG: hypothetical protein ACREDR_22165, partial [Blastocatellia bacterium]